MSASTKNWIGAFLLGAALFAAVGFSYPGFSQIGELQAAIQERADLLSVRSDTVTRLKNFGAEYDQRESEVAKFTSVIPSNKSIAELISAVQSIAAGSGVQIDSVNITDTQAAGAKGPTSRLNLKIDGRAPYNSLTVFVDSMEKNIRLLDVNGIQASTEEGRGNSLRFTITGEAYFLKK